MLTGRAPEKSNFSRRCSLLSRYLKEKGSFGDINIELARKTDLQFTGKSDPGGQQNKIMNTETSENKPFELIQKLSVGESRSVDVSEPENVVPEAEKSQLTIFFAGKVIVYNEFPNDKANEIMEIAKEANKVVVDSKTTQNQMNLDMNIISKSNISIPDLNEPTSSGHNENQVVERIARRASLHRFFAKRKDRVVARAPYQMNRNSDSLPPKAEIAGGPSVEPRQSSHPLANHSKPKRLNNMSMEMDKEDKSSKILQLKL